MSKAQQLPLPYEPPEIGQELRYARQVSAHLGIIRHMAGELRAAIVGANEQSEVLSLLTSLSECADDALHFSTLLDQAVLELGRQNVLIRDQRNESLRERDRMFSSLYACLIRFQRKGSGR